MRIGRQPVAQYSRQKSRTEQKDCPMERICCDHQSGWFEASRLTNMVVRKKNTIPE